ncbi:PepSY domain-containing protein [Nocardia implantans]|uniref:PepSY domain-containing protein n=1 Tax=Nocardia implantans TaxID=3108168 RepID=A0ABU6AUS8_9NOCA|nr:MULTISPECIES: PepSY domain-containing protein [unclassified Nocardia]MBF6192573.1 PepSY domain-containing protein [Nocardia beijingensis]MEA3527520.1 PepSY domain-containing protein [Nocardia sp. CDC192]MEB3511228.1 PepSY domain-containing protein [Nocardia sp. CDC186]
MKSTVGRAFRGRRALLTAAVVAGLLVGGPVALYAATGSHSPDRHAVAAYLSDHEWALTAAPTISREQAVNKAREALPGGTVVSAELDAEGATAVWEVELRTPDGIEHEVTVDANSGAVLGTVKQD